MADSCHIERRKTKNRTAARARCRNARFIYRYLKLFCKCVDCGVKDPRVLEFDHVRGEKKRAISRLVYTGCSLTAMKEEIRKCDVRCANCHNIKTHNFKYHY